MKNLGTQTSLFFLPMKVDARFFFFILLLFVLTCAQGIRPGDTPLPTAVFVCLAYLLIFQPSIPATGLRLYGIIFAYIILVSVRNTLEDTGGIRDFLYIGICVANLLITVTFLDIFDALNLVTIGVSLLIIGSFEVAMQGLEFSNFLGFNNLIHPILEYWAALTKSESFLVLDHAQRTYGTFGSPTVAGLIVYLIFRSAAVALRRQWLIYLGIVPIILGGSRVALVIFVLWEVIAGVILSRRKMTALLMALCFGFFAVIVFPLVFPESFLSQWVLVYGTNFDRQTSVINRLISLDWALAHWQEFLTTGGTTSAQFVARENTTFGIDSEFILRSMQFGLSGYLCFLAMNLWIGFNWKDWNWWFVVVFVLISSMTNAVLTNFVVFPFLIIYCLCVKKSRADDRNMFSPTKPASDLAVA